MARIDKWERLAWIVPHRRFVFQSPHSPHELIDRLKSVVRMDMTRMQRIMTARGGFEGTLLPHGFHIIRLARRSDGIVLPPLVYGHYHQTELGTQLDVLMLFNPAYAGIIAINCVFFAIFLSNFLQWGALIAAALLWLPFLIGYNKEIPKAREFLEELFDATLVVS